MRAGAAVARAVAILGWLALSHLAVAGDTPQTLESIGVTPPASSVPVGGSLQLSVRGHFFDGTELELAADPGTTYTTLPDGIASVSATGLVQGVARGEVTILANNQNILGSIVLSVRIPNDQDDDGRSEEHTSELQSQ